MKKLIYSMLFILSLCCFRCNEPCDSKIETVSLIYKDYFGFWKEGSYWIYENQAQTETDSLFVLNYIYNSGGCGDSKEKLGMDLGFKNSNKVDISGLNISIYGNDAVFHLSEIYFKLDVVNDTLFGVNGKESIMQRSLFLNKKEFRGEIQKVVTEDRIYYFQKNIGLIGYVIVDDNKTKNDTFNLIKHHVEL